MTQHPTPLVLRIWLLLTRILPLSRLSRHLHRRMGADPARFQERLGQPTQTTAGPVIWFHAASLGEVSQIAPLLARLCAAEDGTSPPRILVTTTTQAGAEWVAKNLPDTLHQFAPLDTPRAVAGFLKAWPLTAAIFIESDLSPRMIRALQERAIPHALLNTRHSRTRGRLPKVFAALLSGFSLITCRSEAVAADIRALGVPEARLRVLPDLRVAMPKLPCHADALAALRAHIGTRPVWLAASTHPADEAAVLEAHAAVLAQDPGALLILVPRHPKRAAPLIKAAATRPFTLAQRSAGDPLTPQTQIYLADTLGELGLFFALSPIAFMGGSFGAEGGHNPYEPARFGTAILSGPHVKNFADAYAALCATGAAELVTPDTLGPRITTLMRGDEAAQMGAMGQAFVDRHADSVATTVDLIRDMLKDKNSALL